MHILLPVHTIIRGYLLAALAEPLCQLTPGISFELRITVYLIVGGSGEARGLHFTNVLNCISHSLRPRNILYRWKKYFQKLLNSEEFTQNEEAPKYQNVKPLVVEPSRE